MDYIFVGYPPLPPYLPFYYPPPPAAAAAAALALDVYPDQYNLTMERWTSSTAGLLAALAWL
jgi:hypothetical protein